MAVSLLANNATSTLAAGISDSDTTVTVQSADAAKFPLPTGGQWFPATLIDSSGNREIVRVTARAGAVLTITRAQEGTSALAFSTDDRIDLRFTAATWAELIADLVADYMAKTWTLTAGGGLTGGGDGSANRTVAADYASQAQAEAGTDTAKLMNALRTKQAILALAALPPNHLSGLGLANNATDATNDIDVAAGKCRDDADSANIVVAAMTKQLDASWAAGDDAGMRIGSLADGWWRVFAIGDVSTPAYDIAAAQTASPTLPGSYTVKRQIGWIYRASGVIRPFLQVGDEFGWTGTLPIDNNGTIGTSSVSKTLSAPPLTRARFRAYIEDDTSGSIYVLLRELDYESDSAPSSSVNSLSVRHTGAGSGENKDSEHMTLRVDASSQIAARSNLSSTHLNLTTIGWIDTRGRDA